MRKTAAQLNRQDDLEGFDVKEVRGLIDQERARKEAELADLSDLEIDLDTIETAIASYAGGPDNSNDSDNNGDDQ